MDAAFEASARAGGSYKVEYRLAPVTGKERWIAVEGAVVRNPNGRPVRLLGVTHDITERKLFEEMLQTSEQTSRELLGALAERTLQLSLAGKAALVGSYAYDPNSDMMQISPGYAAVHGLPDGTEESTRSQWQTRAHPDDIVRVEELRFKALRERRHEYGVEYRIFRSGEVRWIESRSFMSYSADGRPQRVVGVNIDITERKRAEDHHHVLVAELDHRVKNVLATVRAVAAHTLDASSSMEQFVAALDGRIQSMASMHELLSRRRWQGLPLAELLRLELAPYATRNNTRTSGPDVMLSPEAGNAIAMVFHELVTNAAKYGALSTRNGRVSVQWHWRLNGNARDGLVIEWQESEGPTVKAPSKAGYGSSVVSDLIPYELGGTADLALSPEGVRCRLEIPSNWVSV